MSPQLISMINMLVSAEETVRLMCRQEMMHCQSDAYNGLKRFYRYNSMDRGKHAVMLENYVVENMQDLNDNSIIPSYEVNFKSSTPTGSMVQQMQSIYIASKNHIGNLSAAAKIAFDEGEHGLGEYLEMMIKDQTKELSRWRRLIKKIKAAGQDEGYLRMLDAELHEKYKAKEKEYFNFKGE